MNQGGVMPALDALVIWIGPAAACLLACGVWRRLARRLGMVDRPNHRSLHSVPVARGGGIPMAVVVALFLLLSPIDLDLALWTGLALAAGLCLVSALDDRFGLPIRVRLLGHLVAAAVFSILAIGVTLPLQWVDGGLVLICTLLIAWMLNLYNFMDGSDGLAAGQGLIGFAALAILAAMSDAPELIWPALAVSGACLGFLWWNFPPARLFLGDSGSVPLGFLAGAFMLYLVLEGGVAPWLVVLPFAPFWMDASFTLLRRILRGEAFWRAHREHSYQHLVRSGAGHRRTALIGYTTMLAGGLGAVVGQMAPSTVVEVASFVAVISLIVSIGGWIRKRPLPDRR